MKRHLLGSLLFLHSKDLNSRVVFVLSLMPVLHTLFPVHFSHFCLSLVLSCTLSDEVSYPIKSLRSKLFIKWMHLLNECKASYPLYAFACVLHSKQLKKKLVCTFTFLLFSAHNVQVIFREFRLRFLTGIVAALVKYVSVLFISAQVFPKVSVSV